MEVTILNPSTNQYEASAAGGNAAQAQLTIGPFSRADALVLISASGSSKYAAGGGRNAGIVLTVNVDGRAVSKDDSFEGESSNITFRAAASHNFILEKNATAKVEARVDHEGSGGTSNSDTRVSLRCFALAAQIRE